MRLSFLPIPAFLAVFSLTATAAWRLPSLAEIRSCEWLVADFGSESELVRTVRAASPARFERSFSQASIRGYGSTDATVYIRGGQEEVTSDAEREGRNFSAVDADQYIAFLNSTFLVAIADNERALVEEHVRVAGLHSSWRGYLKSIFKWRELGEQPRFVRLQINAHFSLVALRSYAALGIATEKQKGEIFAQLLQFAQNPQFEEEYRKRAYFDLYYMAVKEPLVFGRRTLDALSALPRPPFASTDTRLMMRLEWAAAVRKNGDETARPILRELGAYCPLPGDDD
ncbi:hypothetical protein K2X33_07835 [bacterium]|nr:hypothetical protein [bacterium]